MGVPGVPNSWMVYENPKQSWMMTGLAVPLFQETTIWGTHDEHIIQYQKLIEGKDVSASFFGLLYMCFITQLENIWVMCTYTILWDSDGDIGWNIWDEIDGCSWDIVIYGGYIGIQ